MTHRFEECREPRECANCGGTESLAICSRCHSSYFCSLKCQRAYWPFHKTYCKRNEFADAVEESEPRFARWMRKHGKMAQLKDDEVDRIERAAHAACGPSRQEVMDSMYNRLNPKPIEPLYSVEEKRLMRAKEQEMAIEAMQTTPEMKPWQDIHVPEQLGIARDDIKWRQDQTYVEIFVCLPWKCRPKDANVTLTKSSISVSMGSRPAVLHGELFGSIQTSGSHWYIVDSILHITLMKLERRGNFYGKGRSNADTFWKSVVKKADTGNTIQLKYAPAVYYRSYCELDNQAASGASANLQLQE